MSARQLLNKNGFNCCICVSPISSGHCHILKIPSRDTLLIQILFWVTVDTGYLPHREFCSKAVFQWRKRIQGQIKMEGGGVRGLIYKKVRGIHTKSVRTHTWTQCSLYKSQSTWKRSYLDLPPTPPLHTPTSNHKLVNAKHLMDIKCGSWP